MIKQLSHSVRSHLRSGVAITSVTQCTEELVMNALDAGATCIAIRVDLPCFKLQVVDNGTGMTQDQLNRVGERYSTSKCHELEDLNKLQYFGYRGEAVASIRDTSAVLEINSRTCHSHQTFCRMFRKGEALSVTGSAVQRPSVGTTVTVHDLFYNLPVRRKAFNEALELERIRYRIEGIALINPGVSFTLRNDVTGHVLLQTKKSSSMLMSFTHLFGTGKAKSLTEVAIVKDDFSVNGFVGKEGHSNKNLQFVFVNNRLVLKTRIHKTLNHLLSKSLVLKRRGATVDINSKTQSVPQASSPTKQGEKYALFVINVKCPFDVYDITFDPAKTLVEFKDWSVLTNAIDEMVMSFLKRENLISISDVSSMSAVSSTRDDNDQQRSTDNDVNNADPEVDKNIVSETCDNSTENEQSVRDYTNNINTQNLTNCLFSKQVRRPHNPLSKPDEEVEKNVASLESNDGGSVCQTPEQDDSTMSVSSSVLETSENQYQDTTSPQNQQNPVVEMHTKSLSHINGPSSSNTSQDDSSCAPQSILSSSSVKPGSRKQPENSVSSTPSEQSSTDLESVTDVEQCFTKVQDPPKKVLMIIDSEDPFPETMRTNDEMKEDSNRFEKIDKKLICLPDHISSSRKTSEQRLRNLTLFASKPSVISAAQTMSRRLGLTSVKEQNYHKEEFQQPQKSAAQKISERLGLKEKKQISAKLERFKSTNLLSKSSQNIEKENELFQDTDIQDEGHSGKSDDNTTVEQSKPVGSKSDQADFDKESNNLNYKLPPQSPNKSWSKTVSSGARDPVVPTIADIDLLLSSSETSMRKRFNPFALSTASKLAKLAKISEPSNETLGPKEFLSTMSIVQTAESVLKTLRRHNDPLQNDHDGGCNDEVNDSETTVQKDQTRDRRDCPKHEVSMDTILGKNQSHVVPSVSSDLERNDAETQIIDEGNLLPTDSADMDILPMPKQLIPICAEQISNPKALIPYQFQMPEGQTQNPSDLTTVHTEQLSLHIDQTHMPEQLITVPREQNHLPKESMKALPFSVYSETDYAKDLDRVTIMDMSEAESVDSVVLPHVDCYSPVTSDTSTGSLDSSSQSFQPCGLLSQGFSPHHRFYDDDCQSGGFSPRNMDDVRISQQSSLNKCETESTNMKTSELNFHNGSSLNKDDEISPSFNIMEPENTFTEEQRNVVQEEKLAANVCEERIKKDDFDICSQINFSLFRDHNRDSISCGQCHYSGSDQPSASDPFPLRNLLPENSDDMNIQTYDLTQNNNSCNVTCINPQVSSKEATSPDIPINNEIDLELQKEFESDMTSEMVFGSKHMPKDSSVYDGLSCDGVSFPFERRDCDESSPVPHGCQVTDPIPAASSEVLPCSTASRETISLKPTWSDIADPRSGRKIYVNNVTGHTLYEEQWKECGYSLQEQEQEQQESRMEVAQSSSAKSSLTPLSPMGRINLHSMLNCHLEADTADVHVKWRQPSSSCHTETSPDEANSIEDLFSSWSNPVEDIPHQSCVNAEVSHTSRAAAKSYQTLYPTKFTKPMLQTVKVLGQVDNKFIACVLNTNEKNPAQAPDLIVLFDQHAAHERVRLEQLIEDIYEDSEDVTDCRIKQSTISPPKTLTFTEEEVRLIKSFREEFKRIGVVFSVNGSSRESINIHTIPACLVEREANEVRRGRDSVVMDIAESLIKEHLEMLRVTGGARNRLPAAIHKVLCSQACHGAIKFGDGLSLDQCRELLESLSGCDLPFQCAHGRPSIMPLLGLHQLKSKLPAQTTKRPSLWKISKHLPINQ